MPALVAYDVSREQSAVKSEMQKLGYQDYIPASNGTTYHLPDTTLFHHTFDIQRATQDIQAVTRSLGIVLVRQIAVPCGELNGIAGVPRR